MCVGVCVCVFVIKRVGGGDVRCVLSKIISSATLATNIAAPSSNIGALIYSSPPPCPLVTLGSRSLLRSQAHCYSGTFGAHTALIVRRLLRVCALYGATPQVIACSATVGNPEQHFRRLTGLGTFSVTRLSGKSTANATASGESSNTASSSNVASFDVRDAAAGTSLGDQCKCAGGDGGGGGSDGDGDGHGDGGGNGGEDSGGGGGGFCSNEYTRVEKNGSHTGGGGWGGEDQEKETGDDELDPTDRVVVVAEECDGAPSCPRDFILWNPPLLTPPGMTASVPHHVPHHHHPHGEEGGSEEGCVGGGVSSMSAVRPTASNPKENSNGNNDRGNQRRRSESSSSSSSSVSAAENKGEDGGGDADTMVDICESTAGAVGQGMVNGVDSNGVRGGQTRSSPRRKKSGGKQGVGEGGKETQKATNKTDEKKRKKKETKKKKKKKTAEEKEKTAKTKPPSYEQRRASTIVECSKLLAIMVAARLRTIVFCKSRKLVELVSMRAKKYLQSDPEKR